jgi:hypothetical protein
MPSTTAISVKEIMVSSLDPLILFGSGVAALGIPAAHTRAEKYQQPQWNCQPEDTTEQHGQSFHGVSPLTGTPLRAGNPAHTASGSGSSLALGAGEMNRMVHPSLA